jgi:hypothetical protein
MECTLLQGFTNFINAHIVMGRLKKGGIRYFLKEETLSTSIPSGPGLLAVSSQWYTERV